MMNSNTEELAARTALEGRLGSLLGFDDVSDVFEHLLSIDTSEDLLDYLSQLLGDNGEDVQHFVEDVGRFQRREELEHIEVASSSDAEAELQTSIESASASKEVPQSIAQEGDGGTSSWMQQWERDEQDRKEKQAEIDKTVAALEVERQAEEEEAERQKSLKVEKGKKEKATAVQKMPPQAAKPTNARNKPVRGQSQKLEKQKGGDSVDAKAAKKKSKDPVEAAEADKKHPPPRGKAKTICGCFGTHHKPLTNCLHCGRIACRQEGYGYCPFCGYLIEKVTVKAGEDGKFDKALLHKERLLKFDREFAKRTVVLDDQADYYSNTTSAWLDEDEKADAEERDEDRRREMHERKKQVLNISL